MAFRPNVTIFGEVPQIAIFADGGPPKIYVCNRGSNFTVNVVNWFESSLTFVHGALCFKMHKINENGFCNKMLCLQIHTKNACKFLQLRGPPKRAL